MRKVLLYIFYIQNFYLTDRRHVLSGIGRASIKIPVCLFEKDRHRANKHYTVSPMETGSLNPFSSYPVRSFCPNQPSLHPVPWIPIQSFRVVHSPDPSPIRDWHLRKFPLYVANNHTLCKVKIKDCVQCPFLSSVSCSSCTEIAAPTFRLKMWDPLL